MRPSAAPLRLFPWRSTPSSEATVAALRESYGIEPVPFGTVNPPGEYSPLAGALDLADAEANG